jgi:hypothetical protein
MHGVRETIALLGHYGATLYMVRHYTRLNIMPTFFVVNGHTAVVLQDSLLFLDLSTKYLAQYKYTSQNWKGKMNPIWQDWLESNMCTQLSLSAMTMTFGSQTGGFPG